MTRLIDLIANKNAIEFKSEFEDLIKTKVVHALEQEKIAVAQSFFNSNEKIEQERN